MQSSNYERTVALPSNVTPLHDRERMLRLPQSLLALRESAALQLKDLLTALFNNTDDALFERADRSRSDKDQQMYFESMRQLRLNREQISSCFIAHIHEAFESLLVPETKCAEPADLDSLTLVAQEDMEISVAIAGIVSKVTSSHSLNIMLLTKRINHVITSCEVTERRNPLGPQVLGEAFAHALETLDVAITIRIILLKLFERFVMDRLAGLYASANRQLAEAGILPELKRAVQPRPQSATPRPAAAPRTGAGQPQTVGGSWSGEGGGAAGYGPAGFGADFNQISHLLHRQPEHAGQDVAGNWISTDQLVGTLNFLQSEQPSDDADFAVLPARINLGQVLLAKAGHAGQGGLRQADEDVVTFVGMLFDYILNDKNLAIPMKALIARLQIPIVKLAILDKSFFSRSSHPARRLLNELSSAGIGWSSSSERKRDALYNKIESIVVGVLEEFQSNPEVFTRLLEDLTSFVGQERRRTESIEQRVREPEQGKAVTYDAKRRAQNIINQKASGLRLHPGMGRFISETWSKVLVYTCIKFGPQSDAWQDQVNCLDQLLWSIQPLNSLDQVERRDRERPLLLDRLREGMRHINLPDEEIAELESVIRTHLVEISGHDRSYLVDQENVARENVDLEAIPEVVLAPAGEDSAVPLLTVEEETEMARLTEGRWVELPAAGDQRVRCKLAAILEEGGRFVFVNRKGMKVAERHRRELAGELNSGKAVLLDDAEIFDKALQAVIGNLRQLREQHAPVH
ncbi:MAG: DUF1631 domain-containing protein [Pseudomonadales bacterium]